MIVETALALKGLAVLAGKVAAGSKVIAAHHAVGSVIANQAAQTAVTSGLAAGAQQAVTGVAAAGAAAGVAEGAARMVDGASRGDVGAVARGKYQAARNVAWLVR